MSNRLPGYKGNAVSMTPLRDFRRPARLALPAFFALTLTLGMAGPLWADSVSNLTLSDSKGEQITSDYPSAQAFTTGSHSAGYALQSVTLLLAAQVSGNSTVALHSVSGGNPGTFLATLTGLTPNSTTMTKYVYTCSSGCQLDDETSYFIVLTPANRSTILHWGQNTSGAETNTPLNAGWSIADDAKYRNGQGGAWLNEGAVKLMKVTWVVPALTASSVEATSATLGIANYSGTWYYKRTSPSAGQCTSAGSAATKSLSGLDSGTSYTFKAYSDSGCQTELDSADLLTKPGKVSGVSATAGNTSLAVSWTATTGAASYKIQWKSGTDDWDATNRQATSTTTSKTLSSLTNDTAYTLRVAAVNTTGDGAWSDEATGTPAVPSPSLTATNVEATTATLNFANHVNAWSYKRTLPTEGSCSWTTNTTVNLTQLTPGTTYSYRSYSNTVQCLSSQSDGDTASFTTKPGKVSGVSASAGNTSLAVSWTATTDATSYKVQWKSGAQNWDAENRQTTSTTASATLSSLTNNTAYTIRVAAVNATGDGAWSDEATGTPVAPAPDLWVENIHYQTAGLVLRHWTGGAWSWRVAGGRSSGCRNSSGPSHSAFQFLSALNLNTRYTVTAHSGHGCAAANQLDSETFTTRARGWQAPALSVANVGSASATLSIANHTGDWWYAETSGSTTCTKVDAGTGSATLSSLTPNKFYAYEAFSGSGCANSSAPLDWITEKVEFTTSGPVTATVTDLSETWATLAVSGISSGQWSTDHVESDDPLSRYSKCLTYDYTTTSAVVTGLTAGTAYTFYVYRGGKCAFVDDRIATQAHTFRFVSGNVGSTSATLTLENYNGTWYHQQAGGSGHAQAASATGRVRAASTAGDCSTAVNGDTATLTGLTPDTDYTWNAYKDAGCNAVIASTSFTTATAGTSPPTGGQPDQAEAEADLQPTFGAHTIDNQAYMQDQAIEALTLPKATSGNPPLRYKLEPDPPEGLTFNPVTRTLSGTPTQATGPRPYEYTATDADVSEPDVARLTFTIEVVLSAAEQAILEDGLAAQGRALLSGATGVIGERFRNPGASSVAEAGVAACLGEAGSGADDTGGAETETDCATGLLTTVAQAMLGMSGAGSSADPWGMADADDSRPRGPGLTGAGAQPAWDWESLIWGRSFALPLNAQGTPGSAWTLWGAGDIQGFEGSPRQSRYDGQVRSLYLGVDAQWQAQWLAGAALAQSWGETDYVAEPGGSAGQLETTLTSIYPYVRGTLGSGLEVWAIGGYGRGEAEQTQSGTVDTRDLTMAMGATGVRQPMTEVGGAHVALVGGAGYLSLATEEGPAAIADLDVAVNRARLAVEAAWTAGGLAPYVQVGGRYDGGAGQTGAGLETVAGVRYTSERLEFEARGRWLATHAADGYAEYGGLARLAVKPQADGTGFRMAVAPRWGAADNAGLLGGGAALLDGGAMPGLGVNGMPSTTTRTLMLESELGYGVAVFERHGVLTPYGGFAFTGNETRQYRLGARLGMAQWLNLSLEGTRRDSTGPQPADQGVQLQLEGRF